MLALEEGRERGEWEAGERREGGKGRAETVITP